MTKYYKLGIISTHKCNQQCYYCNNYDINYNGKDIINIVRHIDNENYDGAYHRLKDLRENGLENRYLDINDEVIQRMIEWYIDLQKCTQNRDGIYLDLVNHKNLIKLYKTLCSLKNVCTKTNCFFYVKWENVD